MWMVSFLFAGFLTSLGGKIIADLPKISKNVPIENLVNKDVYTSAQLKLIDAKRKIDFLRIQSSEAHANVQFRTNEYKVAKTTFDNWLATRSVTASNPKSKNQDPAITNHSKNLKKINSEITFAIIREDDVNKQKLEAERAIFESERIINGELNIVKTQFNNQSNITELKIFGYRLAFTLPLLIISGLLIAKRRNSNYWPLYRGFVIFAVFTFFVELVPYLPSYGGYVRSVVGIIMCLVGGHYGIKWMKNYLANRQEQVKKNEKVRRSVINVEISIQKINSQICPHCDRIIPQVEGVKVNHCVICGLKLFDICGFEYADGTKCNTRKNAFFKHCPSCGSEKEQVDFLLIN